MQSKCDRFGNILFFPVPLVDQFQVSQLTQINNEEAHVEDSQQVQESERNDDDNVIIPQKDYEYVSLNPDDITDTLIESMHVLFQ